ncbi:MAG: hypothetical protein H0V17_31690 [Deltaproteobacteria bacterium]|nr:hypothetical protein [Deltaproteobacteria bacterium]
MRPLWTVGAFLIACGGGSGAGRSGPVESGTIAKLAEDDQLVPTYDKADLQRALIAERGAEATAERQIRDIEALVAAGSTSAGTDRLRVALVDLAVRRRFIATLETCETQGRWCPPRLDDPVWVYDPSGEDPVPLDAAQRFDLDSWRTITTELHGRACACRTQVCVDGVDVALAQLEGRPMRAVQDDDAAIQSVTRARECLFRLRGKKLFRVDRALPESE